MSNKHSLLLIKWLGTVLCLIGIALTSFNIYPANIVFGLIGSGLWTWAGIVQKDSPLVLVESAATILYLFGIILYIINALTKWGIL
jgi:ABC-type microcin C transport system permease subunit YejB